MAYKNASIAPAL